MTRIAIAGFQHETNTFAPDETPLEPFIRQGGWPAMTRGEELFQAMKGLNIPISGFMDACKHEMIPIIWAMAEPSGYVTADAFDTIAGEIVEGIVKSKPDAAYLDLHGAMVTREHPDAEAELLRRIRAEMGPDFPIAVSLDLHGNLSPAFFDAATVVAIYRTYPHVDFAETGARAAALLDRAMAGPLFSAYRQVDYIVPITAQSTEFSPAKDLYAALSERDAVSLDLALGFPPADIPDGGPSIFAYADTQAAADAAADATVAHLYAVEEQFDARLSPASEAVAQAMNTPGPVVIADPQDNPGAGGTGDTTGILQALIDAEAPDAVLSMLHDPAAAAAAHEAGQGAKIRLELGGKHPQFSSPITTDVIVEALWDGPFQCTGPVFGGAYGDLGKLARLQIAGTGIQVVVGTIRAQNLDQAFFQVVGIEPAEHSIVCVKSAVHFIADYKRITPNILFATAPGANPCDLGTIPYSKLRAGVRVDAA